MVERITYRLKHDWEEKEQKKRKGRKYQSSFVDAFLDQARKNIDQSKSKTNHNKKNIKKMLGYQMLELNPNVAGNKEI